MFGIYHKTKLDRRNKVNSSNIFYKMSIFLWQKVACFTWRTNCKQTNKTLENVIESRKISWIILRGAINYHIWRNDIDQTRKL